MDEEAAEIVRQIFKWTIDGLGPYQIATLLKEKKVEIPAVHMARFGQGNNRNKAVKEYSQYFEPLTIDSAEITDTFTWATTKWPWQKEGC